MSLLQNIVSFIGLFCKSDLWFNRSYKPKPPHTQKRMFLRGITPLNKIEIIRVVLLSKPFCWALTSDHFEASTISIDNKLTRNPGNAWTFLWYSQLFFLVFPANRDNFTQNLKHVTHFLGLRCWQRGYWGPIRPTQSMIYVHLLASVKRFQESILLIVQYKYSKSCTEDFTLQDLNLRTGLCGTGFISQHSRVVDFHLINDQPEMVCTS